MLSPLSADLLAALLAPLTVSVMRCLPGPVWCFLVPAEHSSALSTTGHRHCAGTVTLPELCARYAASPRRTGRSVGQPLAAGAGSSAESSSMDASCSARC